MEGLIDVKSLTYKASENAQATKESINWRYAKFDNSILHLDTKKYE